MMQLPEIERVLIATLIGLVIGYAIALTMNFYDELKRRKR